MTDREELGRLALNEDGLEAAVRECARITAPKISDDEYKRIRADNSPRYQNTREEMARTIRAYLSAAPAQASIVTCCVTGAIPGDGGGNARDFSNVAIDENFYFTWPKPNEVPVQDSGGTQGKSNAAPVASVDANANDDGQRVQTGNNVVTGAESAATTPSRPEVSVEELANTLCDHFKGIVAAGAGVSFEETGVTLPCEALHGYARALKAKHHMEGRE